MSFHCEICMKNVSTRDNLKRHIKEIHDYIPRGTSSVFPTREIPSMSLSLNDCEPLKAPFTMIVSGPTGSGKTVWVQKLLTHRLSTMNPPPQIIYWFFAQWQPAYSEMAATIPGIKFIEGLPSDFEDGDVTTPKLWIIDDLMTESSDSKQISQLFTR